MKRIEGSTYYELLIDGEIVRSGPFNKYPESWDTLEEIEEFIKPLLSSNHSYRVLKITSIKLEN